MSVWARSAAWGVLHAGLAPSCVTPQCLIVSRTECKGQSQGAQKIFMERVRFSCIPMLEMCVYRRAEKGLCSKTDQAYRSRERLPQRRFCCWHGVWIRHPPMPTSVRRWRLCLSAECGARLKGAPDILLWMGSGRD